MNPTGQVDLSEWNKALRELLAKTPKPITETVNTQAFYALRGAKRGTQKASRAKIEALGIVGYDV